MKERTMRGMMVVALAVVAMGAGFAWGEAKETQAPAAGDPQRKGAGKEAKAPTWSEEVGGLRGRLIVSTPVVKTDKPAAIEMWLELENAGDDSIYIGSGFGVKKTVRVTTVDGTEVKGEALPQEAALGWKWVEVKPWEKVKERVSIGTVMQAKKEEAGTPMGIIDTRLEAWRLPVGTYRVEVTYTSEQMDVGDRRPLKAWSGKLNAPAVTVKVEKKVEEKGAGEKAETAARWAKEHEASLTKLPKGADAKTACMARIRKLGIALASYAADHQGKFPDSWGVLLKEEYLAYAASLICPVAGKSVPEDFPKDLRKADLAALKRADDFSDYLLIPGMSGANGADLILAHEKRPFTEGGRCCLFVDIHVEWLTEADFQKRIKAQEPRWSEEVGGLRGRLVVKTPVVETAGPVAIETWLELENAGDKSVYIMSGEEWAVALRITDKDSKEVAAAAHRTDQLVVGAKKKKWREVKAGERIREPISGGTIAEGVKVEAGTPMGVLDTVVSIWKLPVGEYRLEATYSSTPWDNSNRRPLNAWSGKLNAPAVTVEVRRAESRK